MGMLLRSLRSNKSRQRNHPAFLASALWDREQRDGWPHGRVQPALTVEHGDPLPMKEPRAIPRLLIEAAGVLLRFSAAAFFVVGIGLSACEISRTLHPSSYPLGGFCLVRVVLESGFAAYAIGTGCALVSVIWCLISRLTRRGETR